MSCSSQCSFYLLQNENTNQHMLLMSSVVVVNQSLFAHQPCAWVAECDASQDIKSTKNNNKCSAHDVIESRLALFAVPLNVVLVLSGQAEQTPCHRHPSFFLSLSLSTSHFFSCLSFLTVRVQLGTTYTIPPPESRLVVHYSNNTMLVLRS